MNPYPFDDWMDDCKWLRDHDAEAPQPHDPTETGKLLLERFQVRYPADALHDRLFRFEAAMNYLNQNLRSFDEGMIAIVGEKVAGVSQFLLASLWSFYGFCSPAHIDEGPTVELILKGAQAEMAQYRESKTNGQP